MKSKNRKVEKCPVCLHQFKKENLDKHMHSRSHHAAVEKLKGSEQRHKCWACDMYVLGLKQYERHIATNKHITNLGRLQQERCRGNGFKVDYTDHELTAICAKRDQKKQASKLQNKRVKLKRKRAKKASQSQKGFNHNEQLKKSRIHSNRTIPSANRSGNQSRSVEPLHAVRFHSNHDQATKILTPTLDLKASEHKSDQVLGWNSTYWQQPSLHSLKGDLDFTSDLLSPSWGVIFSSQEDDEGCSQQSRSEGSRQKVAFQKRSQKRLLNADLTGSCRVKRPFLTDVPSVNMMSDIKGRYSSERTESEHVSRATCKKPAWSKSRRVKNAEEKSPKVLMPPRFDEFCPSEVISSKQDYKTGKTEVKMNRTSPPLMKSSGRYSLAVSSAGLLKESKTDPQKEQEHTHSRHSLTAMLSRSVSKTESSKPNLNAARGIRSSQTAVKTGSKSRVLKPALQKLISSKGSQRSLNWGEIYQEVTKRKLQREKGVPRFGIELVSPLAPEPPGLALEEVEGLDAVDEGFHWKSISPDNVIASSSAENACASQPAEARPGQSFEKHDGETSKLTLQPVQCNPVKMKSGPRRNDCASGTDGSERPGPIGEVVGKKDALTTEPAFETKRGVTPGFRLFYGKAEKLDDFGPRPFQSSDDHSRFDSKLGRCIKTEKTNAPNTRIQSTEVSKRKLSKLLTVFQRENELSSCLEDVNSQLLLAQAALHSAFRGFQHLQGIKQQVSSQMTALRGKRIEILRRMQNSRKTSGVNSPVAATESHQGVPDTAAQPRDIVPNRSFLGRSEKQGPVPLSDLPRALDQPEAASNSEKGIRVTEPCTNLKVQSAPGLRSVCNLD